MPLKPHQHEQSNTALPPGIEVFRVGTHIDDQGVSRTFTAADLAATAAAYDPTLREAPLTIGHPVGDRPAYGWVKSTAVSASGRLTIDTHQVQPAFAEAVAARRFKKRSIAFYPPGHPNNPKPGVWYPRHVAFLGAQPPAVSGLADIEFADDAAGLVSFSEPATPAPPTATPPAREDESMTTELQAQVAAEKARADKAEADAAAAKAEAAKAAADAQTAAAQLAQFAEAQRAAAHADHVAFAEGLQAAGKLSKPDVAAAVAVLDLLGAAAPVQFGEGDAKTSLAPGKWLRERLAAAQPLVAIGEVAAGELPGAAAGGRTDAQIDAQARAYMKQHNVSYSDALNKVVTFTANGA